MVFSSCILYNNFVTIQQRRLQAQIEQEQKERIVMVAELKEAVKHKVWEMKVQHKVWREGRSMSLHLQREQWP